MGKVIPFDRALDSRARNAAKRVGLMACKYRDGFMLIDPKHNEVVWGDNGDLTAAEVLHYCKGTELLMGRR